MFHALATLPLLAAPHLSPGQDPVRLRWNLSEEATYRVASTQEFVSVTVTQGDTQEQSQVNRATHLISVEGRNDEGNLELSVTLESMGLEQVTPQQKIILEATRDADGAPVVEVDIEAALPLMEGDDVVAFFEALGRNMLELEFEFEVTPQGKVIRAGMNQDPYADLPMETEVTRMAAKTIAMLLDAKDLPAMAAAEMFTQLSPDPVEVGGSWEVAREIVAMGLDLSGAGKATLVSLKDGRAELREQLTYAVDASGFSAKMEDLMGFLFETMGLELQVEVHLAGEDFKNEVTSTFDVRNGHTLLSTNKNLGFSLEGQMEVGPEKIEMEMELTGSYTSRWERLKR
ncbi:MAG: hypothetical protein O2816_02120 [Planctomycetota bacterium]|nr:hypothetical protein [Planctomycetota bacterium]